MIAARNRTPEEFHLAMRGEVYPASPRHGLRVSTISSSSRVLRCGSNTDFQIKEMSDHGVLLVDLGYQRSRL